MQESGLADVGMKEKHVYGNSPNNNGSNDIFTD